MLHVYLGLETCQDVKLHSNAVSLGRHSHTLAPKWHNLVSLHRRFVTHQPRLLLPTGIWRHTGKQSNMQRQYLQSNSSQTNPMRSPVLPADEQRKKIYIVTLTQSMSQSLMPFPSSSGSIYRNSQHLFLASQISATGMWVALTDSPGCLQAIGTSSVRTIRINCFKYFLIQLEIIFSLVYYTFHLPLEVPTHRRSKSLSLHSVNLWDINRNMGFICHSSLTKRVSDEISAETP